MLYTLQCVKLAHSHSIDGKTFTFMRTYSFLAKRVDLTVIDPTFWNDIVDLVLIGCFATPFAIVIFYEVWNGIKRLFGKS